jgi:type IX secretion system PorP/SprF family membrane protein
LKRFLIIVILSISVYNGSSQNLFPVYSQYMFNGLALNPAYAGSRDVLNITLGYRNQWVGFDGAPVTQTLSAHSPLRNDKVALGIFLQNEQIDVRNNTSMYLNYAYRMNMGGGLLSLGLKGGGVIRSANWSRLSVNDPGDDVFNDPGSRNMLPNVGFGVYYYTDRYYIGASVPFFLSDSTKNGKAVSYHDMQNYNYLLSGGLIAGNGFVKLKPNFLLKYNNINPIQLDVNLSLIFTDLLWVGASYRIENALVGLVKVQLNEQFRIGYTYDYSLGQLNQFNNGSHEIVLIYDFRYRMSAVNPRYF